MESTFTTEGVQVRKGPFKHAGIVLKGMGVRGFLWEW